MAEEEFLEDEQDEDLLAGGAPIAGGRKKISNYLIACSNVIVVVLK